MGPHDAAASRHLHKGTRCTSIPPASKATHDTLGLASVCSAKEEEGLLPCKSNSGQNCSQAQSPLGASSDADGNRTERRGRMARVSDLMGGIRICTGTT